MRGHRARPCPGLLAEQQRELDGMGRSETESVRGAELAVCCVLPLPRSSSSSSPQLQVCPAGHAPGTRGLLDPGVSLSPSQVSSSRLWWWFWAERSPGCDLGVSEGSVWDNQQGCAITLNLGPRCVPSPGSGGTRTCTSATSSRSGSARSH